MAKIYMFCVIKSPIDGEKFTRALGTTRMSPIDARLKKRKQVKASKTGIRTNR
nr:MAG TPA: hypothetical protein [Caudoviricetes sp.]